MGRDPPLDPRDVSALRRRARGTEDGLHGSPTGELFLEDVRVGRDRLLGETEETNGRGDAEDTFGNERSGVVAMALGIVERCLALSTDPAVSGAPQALSPKSRRGPCPMAARELG